jgi:hypothetical protein
MGITRALPCFVAVLLSPGLALADPFSWQGGVYPSIGTEGVVIQSYGPGAPVGPNSVNIAFYPGSYTVGAVAFNTDEIFSANQILIDTGRQETWTFQQNVQIPGFGHFKWLATPSTPIFGMPISIDITGLPSPPTLTDFVPSNSSAEPWFAVQLVGPPGTPEALGSFWAISTPEPASFGLACLALPALLLARRQTSARVIDA